MRTLIQRVTHSSVTVNGVVISEISEGLTILLAIEESDNEEDIEWLCNKIANLRIFDDENGVMNKSVLDTDGEVLVISQFTLFASTKKGNRPSYIRAAKPETATPLYRKFCDVLGAKINKSPKTGQFGAHMSVEINNNGPVTIWMDTKQKE